MTQTIPARSRGVTLIELVVALSVVAILASLALPSYSAYVARTKRAVAKSMTSMVVDQQEQFFLDNKRYANDLTELGYDAATVAVDDSGTLLAVADADRIYIISLDNVSATTYTVVATPQLNQASQDDGCGALSLTHTGQKLSSGADDDCW